jgi:probable F420-dependent oxidoreductase
MTEPAYAKYPVRISAQIQPQRCSFAQLRRVMAELEGLGVDVLMNWDHFFPHYGPPEGETYECWTTLAAWAEATTEVEIGPLVTCAAFRNPDLLADMARTVDHISGGRLLFGIGAGWDRRDFVEYGYEFGTPGTRLDALERALPRIKAKWESLNPRPVRRIPVLVGGNGVRRTLRLAALHADIWHGFGDAATLADLHRRLDLWCAEVGRDPGEIERATRVFRKSPDDVGKSLVDVGTRLFTLVVPVASFDPGPVRDWLAFRDDVNRARLTPTPVGGAA